MRPDTKFDGDDLRRTDPKFRQPRFGQYLRPWIGLDQLAEAAVRQARPPSRRALDARSGRDVALWGARAQTRFRRSTRSPAATRRVG